MLRVRESDLPIRDNRRPCRPALSDDEIADCRAEDEQDAALVIVAGFAGLRMGELLALRWRHINFQAQRVHVQRSYAAGQESSPEAAKAAPSRSPISRHENSPGWASGRGSRRRVISCSAHGSAATWTARLCVGATSGPATSSARRRRTCRRCASTIYVTPSGRSPRAASTSSTCRPCSATPTPVRRRDTCTLGRPRRTPRSSARFSVPRPAPLRLSTQPCIDQMLPRRGRNRRETSGGR